MKKNKLKAMRNIAEIIALIAVTGFSMTACDDGNSNTHTCTYSSTWSSNATTHYKQCSCGEKIDIENHVGNPCNVCGYNSSGSSYSLDGVWADSSGTKITVSGDNGVISAIVAPNALWTDGLNRGYIAIGDTFWTNLTSTGNLTWSGQQITITYNTSSANVAIGTNWTNITFTMSANGQTISTSDGNTWTRYR